MTGSNTEPDYFRASLRICSKVLHSSHITAMLETSPTDSGDIGEPLNWRHSNSRLRTNTIWILQSSIDKMQPLNEHLEDLLSFIESKRQAFATLEEQSEIDIFCGCFFASEQGGYILDSNLLKRIASLPISLDLVFDLYVNNSPYEK